MRPQSDSVRTKIVLFDENVKLMVIKLISSFFFVKTHSNCKRSKAGLRPGLEKSRSNPMEKRIPSRPVSAAKPSRVHAF